MSARLRSLVLVVAALSLAACFESNPKGSAASQAIGSLRNLSAALATYRARCGGYPKELEALGPAMAADGDPCARLGAVPGPDVPPKDGALGPYRWTYEPAGGVPDAPRALFQSYELRADWTGEGEWWCFWISDARILRGKKGGTASATDPEIR